MDTKSDLGGSLCTNGHPLTDGQAFCPTCGSAARNEYARPEWDLLDKKPTKTPKPKTDKTVIAWTVAIVVALILVVALVLVVSHHGGESQSYKDGYSYERQAGACGGDGCFDGFSGETGASANCSTDWYGVSQSGTSDNQSQWMSGCEAAWNIYGNGAKSGNS